MIEIFLFVVLHLPGQKPVVHSEPWQDITACSNYANYLLKNPPNEFKEHGGVWQAGCALKLKLEKS